jgi:uncharacterized protein (TIGR02145 family)/prepilin-type N-terminal cleavage/methylation domain-containing protein
MNWNKKAKRYDYLYYVIFINILIMSLYSLLYISWKKKTMNRKWFTLIEMLIVIVIIGVLAWGLNVKLQSIQDSAENIATMKDINAIVTALEVYKTDYNTYPIASTCNWIIKTDCSLSGVSTELSSYLKSMPKWNTKLLQWTIGNGNIVPAWNAYGYIGTWERYILSYKFIDSRDGQRYKAVKMPDERRWMAENLNYKTANSVCYDNLDSNCLNWNGRLYTWDEAQTACPSGRHLASDDEWTTMLNKVEAIYNGNQSHQLIWNNGSYASRHLMSVQRWSPGIDSLGFSVTNVGGWIWWGTFHGIGWYGFYRSSGQNGANWLSRMFSIWSVWVNHEVRQKNEKRTIRCVKK